MRLSPEQFQHDVSEAAYFLWQARERDGAPGTPAQDWQIAIWQIIALENQRGGGR